MLIRRWGRQPWQRLDAEMRAFTAARNSDTPDELWMVEHDPVFTLGLAAKSEHLLAPGDIPVLPSNRGGQVTYHGPGQVVAYPLIDLRRRRIFVKEYVYRLEESLLAVLSHLGITGHRVSGAPGIYVQLHQPQGHAALAMPPVPNNPFRGLGKIAALGIKVSQHCTYHGAALNVAMDLEPFSRINPCGYADLQTVDLQSLGVTIPWEAVAELWADELVRKLSV